MKTTNFLFWCLILGSLLIFPSYAQEAITEENTPVETPKETSVETPTTQTPELTGAQAVTGEEQKEVKKEIPDEYMQAYEWAFSKWITTKDSYEKARMDDPVTRAEMSKMIAVFVMNTLWGTIDASRQCSFSDTKDLDPVLELSVQMACKLWVMWQWITEFKPNDSMTRAQFWTILSRLLRWSKNDGGDPYYVNHLNALKKVGIMKKVSYPTKSLETRWNVMLMLMRTQEYKYYSEMGWEAIKEEPKAEEQKQEEIKPEETKVEEPKVEEQKTEEVKTEEPKVEEQKEEIKDPDTQRKMDLAKIWSAIITYFNDKGEWPNWTGASDASVKMQPIEVIKDLLKAVGMEEIPLDVDSNRKFSGINSKIINWQYGYYVGIKNWIKNGGFLLMMKPDNEENANLLISQSNLDGVDLAEVKTCWKVLKSKDYGQWSCRSSMDSENVCSYCDEEDLRYVYIF